jgi:hypothetical protein
MKSAIAMVATSAASLVVFMMAFSPCKFAAGPEFGSGIPLV